MAGINALWLLRLLPGGAGTLAAAPAGSNLGLLAGIAAFGALLPDLDASESKIKHLPLGGIRPFALPAALLHRALGHRSLLHSLLGLGLASVLLAVPLAVWLGWQAGLALVLGYASHLLLDACTRSGIPLLFPDTRRVHLLPKGLRLVTGSLAEEVLFALLADGALLLLLLQFAAAMFSLTTLLSVTGEG
jgi:membrane-bound metal-dependent hydrolase YbcI (DUF457 family)